MDRVSSGFDPIFVGSAGFSGQSGGSTFALPGVNGAGTGLPLSMSLWLGSDGFPSGIAYGQGDVGMSDAEILAQRQRLEADAPSYPSNDSGVEDISPDMHLTFRVSGAGGQGTAGQPSQPDVGGGSSSPTGAQSTENGSARQVIICDDSWQGGSVGAGADAGRTVVICDDAWQGAAADTGADQSHRVVICDDGWNVFGA
jgi:hypothetical protein